MSNVVSLFQRPGETTFILCPCTDDGTPVTPVVIHGSDGPLIAGLVCPECETEMPVVNGYIDMSGGVDA